jgi:hypothetical protein
MFGGHLPPERPECIGGPLPRLAALAAGCRNASPAPRLPGYRLPASVESNPPAPSARSCVYATVSSSAPSSTTGPPRLDADDTFIGFPQAMPLTPISAAPWAQPYVQPPIYRSLSHCKIPALLVSFLGLYIYPRWAAVLAAGIGQRLAAWSLKGGVSTANSRKLPLDQTFDPR